MLWLFVSMLSESLPLLPKMESTCSGEAVVVDVEDGDFELEAGVRDPKPGGTAMDDDLKPGART
eukprot:2940898-Pyramimonas_sp.AAC.1